MGIKAVILISLTLIAVAALTEEYIANGNPGLTIEYAFLVALLPVSIICLCVQYRLSNRVIDLIIKRDNLYIIRPNSGNIGNGLGTGALTKMRKSLRAHLERQMRKNRVPTSAKDVDKY
ncbi:hypothetical protein DdX_06019 [Ditylenchus destructor]|uniref:Uncharacterized protein n=1 Tax=Ditylenchus destructor TaxID=166010 RepID=A0AAD4NBZ9_9BILA|nr:hypothetical protein DdX_06019 [Ditylenchus destructor]